MDACVNALDTCVIKAQNYYVKQIMRAMEETKHKVQNRVAHKGVDNDSVVTQP